MAVIPPRKRRRLSPPEESDDEGAQAFGEADLAGATSSGWNLEQDYETRPRKQKAVKESTRLPIKTADGRVEQVQAPLRDAQEDELFSDLSDEEEVEGQQDEQEEPEEPKIPIAQQILKAKEELARIATQINEDPEENIGLLRTLANITSSRTSTITMLGLATQLAVYKDIIPGYRIRPLSEDDLRTRISKDVRKVRNFEQAIVGGYQHYIKELTRISGLSKGTSEAAAMSKVAVSCACNLLNAVPHFNFRADLLRIVVGKLSSRSLDAEAVVCCEALEKLFQNDDDGNASLEAVGTLAAMIKKRNCITHERVISLFLHLRLLTEFSRKASSTRVDRAQDDDVAPQKMSKKQREFRTKKERKNLKEKQKIEKEMKEADAVVGHEQRDQMQAETLKLVFGVYIRILKARTPTLMGPVLEGLAKYAHLINQDFFGDLLESLRELILEADLTSREAALEDEDELSEELEDDDATRNITRESLLCIVTAFALLQGQGGEATTLNLDLSFFVSHLFHTLLPSSLYSDLENLLTPAGTAIPINAASTRSKVDAQTAIVLLLRSLQAVLLPSNPRSVPPIRAAAFTKQIMTSSLHVPEKSCMAMLGLSQSLLRAHKRKIATLWHSEERKGDGVYDPLSRDVEGSNPFTTSVWEGELLRRHFAPAVRDSVKQLEGAVKSISAA
jgi:nucleolar complex protein 3